MKKQIFKILFLFFSGSIWGSEIPLQIVSYSPSGRTEDTSASFAVSVTFNQPMVPLSSPEEMAGFCPLEIKPHVDGRCRWQGTQVLSFEPASAPEPAMEWTVKIPAGTKSKVSGAELKGDVWWKFETVRPNLVITHPNNGERWVSLEPVLLAVFNMDMDPIKAQKFIQLFESDLDKNDYRQVPVSVRRAIAKEIQEKWHYNRYYHWDGHKSREVMLSSHNVIAIKPVENLKKDKAYKLIFSDGLPAAKGYLGIIGERTVGFETYYTFKMIDYPSKQCLPDRFQISFSNPVYLKDLYDNMSVEPSTPMPNLNEWEKMSSGSKDPKYRKVWFSLPDIGYKPDSFYNFRIDVGLKDIFGNVLAEGKKSGVKSDRYSRLPIQLQPQPQGEENEFVLETDWYCPSWNMPTGFGILESYLPPRHPVEAVNAFEIPLVKAKISENEFIPFYNTVWTNYHAIPANSIQKNWNLSEKRNIGLKTFIDFTEVLAPDKGGMAFARIPSPRSNYPMRALDNVTAIGLTVKTSPDSAFIWTTYLRTGQPAKNMPVEIRDNNNNPLWKGNSDSNGFVDAPGWKYLGIKDWKRWERPRLWVFAYHSNGTAIMSSDVSREMSPWRFNISYDWYPRPEHYRGSLFTERGVYRPGEKVFIKGILRKLEKGDWEYSDIGLLQLKLKNSRGEEVLKTTVSVSAEFSSFDFEYPVPENSPTGIWSIEVSEPFEEKQDIVRPVEGYEEGEYREYSGREKKVELYESFRVEEFKPASFEVKVTPRDKYYFAGSTYSAVIDGWYLFGEPMADCTAEWKIQASPAYYDVPGYEGFSFSSGWWDEHFTREVQMIGSGINMLDLSGKTSVVLNLDRSKFTRPSSLVIEAAVISPERQRLFARASSMVHPAEFYIGVKPSSTFQEAGGSWSADIITVTPEGKKIKGAVIEGRIIRREWLSARRAGVGGRLEWMSEKNDTEISSFTFVSEDAYAYKTLFEVPGFYFLSVSGKDEQGRIAKTGVSFYITGKGRMYWEQQDKDIIELVPDKKSYKVGDTAKILVKSPYDKARALVTLEREGMLDRWTETIEGGADTIKFPVKEKYLPNVYVSVILIRPRVQEQKYDPDSGDDLAKPQAKFGYANIPVNPEVRKLEIELKTGEEKYKPQEEVRLKLKVRDEKDRAVKSEITVFVVDEGVLALTAYRTPDVFSDFYGPRPLQFATVDSRLHIIGQRDFGEKGENRGGGGAGAVSLEGIDLRMKFVPTAYWNPSVKTDADGKAELKFALPDNLTKFRIMAVANSGKMFGSGQKSIIVTKPILLKPSLPRFSRIGDGFKGGAVVHNYTGETSTVTIAIEKEGNSISFTGEKIREMIVQAGKAVEVLWDMKADAPGKTAFKFKALAGKESDGLKWEVPVKLREKQETVVTTGVTEKDAVEMISLPSGPQDWAEIETALSASAFTGIREGVKFLLEYPYGCLEQKLSRALPVITGADFVATYKLGNLDEMKVEVQEVFTRIHIYQHPSGGFGYWPNPCLPDPYITSYALETMYLAKKEGYFIADEVIKKAIRWLKDNVGQRTNWAYPYSESEEYSARSYAIYTLALFGEYMPSYFSQLYQKRHQIPFLAKAYLIKSASILNMNPQITNVLLEELMNQSRIAPQTMHFEEPAGLPMPWIHSSNVKTTAVILESVLESRGEMLNSEKVIKWLINERKIKGRWRTTQENAATLRAFQSFYRKYEKIEPDFTAEVLREIKGGFESLWSLKFSSRELTAGKKTFSLQDIFKDEKEAKMKFSKTGAGRLYYSLRMNYSPSGYDKSAYEGLEIEKSIKPLHGDREGNIKPGSRLIITLKVKTRQDRTFVVVDDPLPGGFEIVDPSFAVESSIDAKAVTREGYGYYWGDFNHSEKYDDRMLLFADYLTQGEHTYSYLVQATTPGNFSIPATWAEGMYEPEVFGRTTSASVEIK